MLRLYECKLKTQSSIFQLILILVVVPLIIEAHYDVKPPLIVSPLDDDDFWDASEDEEDFEDDED